MLPPPIDTERMISFKDWLASQEPRLRAEQIAQDQAKESWVQSVARLVVQIDGWIKESDPHQLVRLDHVFPTNGSSPEGGYASAKLDISLGSQCVSIKPVIINVLGPRWKPGEGRWAGLVEMSGGTYPYELYRFVHSDDREEWFLRNTRDYQMKPFDQASFDAALVDSFS